MDELNRDVISEIMVRLQPKDVLNLIWTSASFYHMDHFARLMRCHYPDCVPTNNPRKQYLAITLGFRTYYKIYGLQQTNVISDPIQITIPFRCLEKVNPNSFHPQECHLTISKKYQIEHYTMNDTLFYMKGLPIPNGTDMWFGFLEDQSWGYEIVVMQTRIQLAEYISKNHEAYLQDLIWTFKGHNYETLTDSQICELPAFNRFLKENNVELTPFTEENIFKFVMSHSYFLPNMDSEIDNWIFFTKTF